MLFYVCTESDQSRLHQCLRTGPKNDDQNITVSNGRGGLQSGNGRCKVISNEQKTKTVLKRKMFVNEAFIELDDIALIGCISIFFESLLNSLGCQ